MFNNFITNIVDQTSYKRHLGEFHMLEFAKGKDVYFIKSDLLYRLYALYMGDNKKIKHRPEFYRRCGAYLYYEKLNCLHGDEYYYYVRFNVQDPFYQENEHLIKELILANDPSTLTDYIGTKDIHSYNKNLK